jgi:hypothetical protein
MMKPMLWPFKGITSRLSYSNMPTSKDTAYVSLQLDWTVFLTPFTVGRAIRPFRLNGARWDMVVRILMKRCLLS